MEGNNNEGAFNSVSVQSFDFCVRTHSLRTLGQERIRGEFG